MTDAIMPCTECGHLHFDRTRHQTGATFGTYIPCPLLSEGCACPNARGDVLLTLHIDNVYVEDGDTIEVDKTVTVPAAPVDRTSKDPSGEHDTEWDAWAYDYLYSETGTGREEGDAGYFVEITASPDDPTLVGQKFEWGI